MLTLSACMAWRGMAAGVDLLAHQRHRIANERFVYVGRGLDVGCYDDGVFSQVQLE